MQTYINSGNVKGLHKDQFLVEKQVQSMTVAWISESKHPNLTLVSPEGNENQSFHSEQDESALFDGAFVHSVSIPNPSPGDWLVKAQGADGPYILNVHYDSPLNECLTFEYEMEDRIYLYMTSHHEQIKLENLHLGISIEYLDVKNRRMKKGKINYPVKTPRLIIQPFGEGIYNLTIQIRGKTREGVPFNRTLMDSLYFKES